MLFRSPQQIVTMLNGKTTKCGGEVIVELSVDRASVQNQCLVAPSQVCGADVILGMDIIRRLGGVCISKDSCVSWGSKHCVVGAAAVDRDRKSTRLNSSHVKRTRMPSSA